MDTPFIVIQGSKGKFSTLKYLGYIFKHSCKLNVLQYDFDNNNNIVTNMTVNNNVYINIAELKKDVKPFKDNYDKLEQEDSLIFTEISALIYAIVRYKIDVVICKNNILLNHFNVIACGLTTIENHESQDLNYTLETLLGGNNSILRPNIPLIISPNIKSVTRKIIGLCIEKNVPLFVSNFYHLKYIDFDTKIKSRYSYINLSLALVLVEIYNRTITCSDVVIELDGKKATKSVKETRPFSPLNYKLVDYGDTKVYFCPYPKVLPSLKGLYFDDTYSYIKKIKKNITIYVDNAGSYKSNNLLTQWFNSNIKPKDKNIGIFYYDTNVDLIKSLLPITTIDFDTIFIPEYNKKGRSYESIVSSYDNEINLNKEIVDFKEEIIWSQTIYEILSAFYTDPVYEFGRKRSIVPLNEYQGLNEIIDDNDEEFMKYTLPKNTPTIIVDDLPSIINWILNLTYNNESVNYNILVSGCKVLTYEFNQLINLI